MSKVLYVIDPGHYTKYNQGANKKYFEGDKMFTLALLQKKYLELYGITVILTKNSAAENPSLSARGKVAIDNAKGYDIVIFESLHSNAPGSNADPEKVYGALAIRSKYLPDNDPFIKALVNTVVETMKKDTEVTYSRGISTRLNGNNTDYYGVIRSAVQGARSEDDAKKGPVDYAFIMEHGFHANTIECNWLLDDKNLDKLAKNKAAKVAEWFGLASTGKDEEDDIYTSIMGTATCTAEQMCTYLLSVNPKADVYATEIPKLFLEEGAIEGVRGDIAFAQSCHETGNFKFTGDVTPDQNNFAGIGTTGGGVKGAYFKNARMGVRAQIQHLKAYASTAALKQECVDPRFGLVTRGVAPKVEDLGGRWAYPGFSKSQYKSLAEAKAAKDSYGDKIVKILKKIEDIEIKKEDKEEIKQEGELYIVASACPSKGVYEGRVGAFMILDNAIRMANSENKKIFADSTGTLVYPKEETPKEEPKYYRVAKSYSNGKYENQITACIVLTNAIKACKSGYQVFNPEGEPIYPTFKNVTLTTKLGYIQIINDEGEGIELHYTPEFGNDNLDKVHGPAHLGDVFDVVGTVTDDDNTMYLLSNGSYITMSDKYVKFVSKDAKLTYTAGKYKTEAECVLREGPGNDYGIVPYDKMTAAAKEKNPDKKTGAYFRKGATFSATEVINTDNTAWAKCQSGWICLEGRSKNKQVKYCTSIK